MTGTADAVTLTASLCEIRDTMRLLHGEHYQARVQPTIDALRRVMRRTGLHPLQIVARSHDAPDVVVMQLAAAAVEIIEADAPRKDVGCS